MEEKREHWVVLAEHKEKIKSDNGKAFKLTPVVPEQWQLPTLDKGREKSPLMQRGLNKETITKILPVKVRFKFSSELIESSPLSFKQKAEIERMLAILNEAVHYLLSKGSPKNTWLVGIRGGSLHFMRKAEVEPCQTELPEDEYVFKVVSTERECVDIFETSGKLKPKK